MVDVKAFITLEESLAAVMHAGFAPIAKEVLDQLHPLIEDGKWNEAHAAIDRMSFQGAVSSQRKKLEEIAVAALLFGAHRVTGDLRTVSYVAEKARLPHTMGVALDQLEHAIEHDAADYLRNQLHELVAETEEAGYVHPVEHPPADSLKKTNAQEIRGGSAFFFVADYFRKFNENHDEKGRFASGDGAGGGSVFEDASRDAAHSKVPTEHDIANADEAKGISVRESPGVTKDWLYIDLSDDAGNKVGSIEATREYGKKELQIREAHVEDAKQGKGYGKSLYLAALAYADKHGLSVRSDRATSVSADHVWQSLAKVIHGISRNPHVELDAALGKYYGVSVVGGYTIRSDEPVWTYKGGVKKGDISDAQLADTGGLQEPEQAGPKKKKTTKDSQWGGDVSDLELQQSGQYHEPSVQGPLGIANPAKHAFLARRARFHATSGDDMRHRRSTHHKPLRKASEKTLYVNRPLTNGADIVEWAKSQGFKTTLPLDDLHTTICYSKEPVDWDQFTPHQNHVYTPPGDRQLHRFGDAIVLIFKEPLLQKRHDEFGAGGASFDYDEYRCHVTISYDPDLDVSDMAPYYGNLDFGPEEFAEITPSWSDDITEEVVKCEACYPHQLRLRKADVQTLAERLNDAVVGSGKKLMDIGANMTTSRLVTLGFLSEATKQGVTKYRINEVLDEVTCPFCELMDGKVFSVDQQFSKTMTTLGTSDPAALKMLAPWPSTSKASMQGFEGMSDDDLQGNGYGAPPFHPHCRGVLEMLKGGEETAPNSLIDGLVQDIISGLEAGEAPSDIAEEAHEDTGPVLVHSIDEVDDEGIKKKIEQIDGGKDTIDAINAYVDGDFDTLNMIFEANDIDPEEVKKADSKKKKPFQQPATREQDYKDIAGPDNLDLGSNSPPALDTDGS